VTLYLTSRRKWSGCGAAGREQPECGPAGGLLGEAGPLPPPQQLLPTHSSRGFSSTATWNSGCGDNSDTGGQATRVTDDGDITCNGDNVRRPQSCPADPAGIGADNVTIITLPSDPGVAIKTVAEKSGSSRESESLSPALPCDAGEATNSTLDINTSMGNSGVAVLLATILVATPCATKKRCS